jgi:hypothetical protein
MKWILIAMAQFSGAIFKEEKCVCLWPFFQTNFPACHLALSTRRWSLEYRIITLG